MTVTSIERAAPAGFAALLFLGALALVTAGPMVVLGSAPFFHLTPASFNPVIPFLLMLTGVGHIGATSVLYADPGFWPLMRSSWARFYVLPIAAAVGCQWLFEASPAIWTPFYSGFLAWQFYHFQRQNYGVISFAAIYSGFGELPRETNLMLNLSALAGALSIVWHSHVPAIVALALSGAVLVYMLPKLRGWVLLFSILGWGFFIPAIFIDDPFFALWSYGMAHGAQYVLFITIIASGWQTRIIGLAVLAILLPVMWAIFQTMNTGTLFAAYAGITIGHFLVDAKVWRMREPTQRALLRERFAFLFS